MPLQQTLTRRRSRRRGGIGGGSFSSKTSITPSDSYFTADEGPYLKAVVSLWHEYMRLLNEPERDTMPPHDDYETALHRAAVAAIATFDPTEAARDERREAMKEPE